jgi:hypothetical protein
MVFGRDTRVLNDPFGEERRTMETIRRRGPAAAAR